MPDGRAVRNYLKRIIGDIDAGRKPTRHVAAWARTLLGTPG